jgi:hypothetical protein
LKHIDARGPGGHPAAGRRIPPAVQHGTQVDEGDARQACGDNSERRAYPYEKKMNTGRLAGAFYLGTFVTGFAALAFGTGMEVANAIATVCYIGVTVLFYILFKPVNHFVTLLAALFSAIGCALGLLRGLHLMAPPINELAFFGCYCILIGALIYASDFLPRALGVLLAIGGVSWLTFAWPSLARSLSPFNYVPGIFAEGLLTIWLLVFGAAPRVGRNHA